MPFSRAVALYAVCTALVGFLVALQAGAGTAHADGRKRPPKNAAEHEGNGECTPGYDPCIAPGPDVDCAGGSGNGPRYVEGPVYVTGSDPYDLDRDGDGVGCE